MKLSSASFTDGDRLPAELAFCVPGDESRVCLGGNRNPHLLWDEVPDGTRSFALVCHDPDVPSKGDDVNQEGRSVPFDLPRVDFFHWLLVDIPADRREIAAGSFSAEVTPGGKPGPAAALGTRQGVNDYTAWFAADESMRGDYYGYDGPYPPPNDQRMHRYFFRVFALGTDRLELPARFTAGDVFHAMQGNVLAETAIHGTYCLNPKLAGK